MSFLAHNNVSSQIAINPTISAAAASPHSNGNAHGSIGTSSSLPLPLTNTPLKVCKVARQAVREQVFEIQQGNNPQLQTTA
jgi:hypothetical protein